MKGIPSGLIAFVAVLLFTGGMLTLNYVAAHPYKTTAAPKSAFSKITTGTNSSVAEIDHCKAEEVVVSTGAGYECKAVPATSSAKVPAKPLTLPLLSSPAISRRCAGLESSAVSMVPCDNSTLPAVIGSGGTGSGANSGTNGGNVNTGVTLGFLPWSGTSTGSIIIDGGSHVEGAADWNATNQTWNFNGITPEQAAIVWMTDSTNLNTDSLHPDGTVRLACIPKPEEKTMGPPNEAVVAVYITTSDECLSWQAAKHLIDLLKQDVRESCLKDIRSGTPLDLACMSKVDGHITAAGH